MKREIEKIEVSKGNGSFYYTGSLSEVDDIWVQIETTRGETLKFRREQIMQRREIAHDTRDDTNGQRKRDKNI